MEVKTLLLKYLSNYKNGYNNTGAMRWLYVNDPDLWGALISATNFLHDTALPKQRAWHVLNDVYERVLRQDSTEEATWQGSKYFMFKGVGGHMKNANCVEGRKAKFLSEHGVDNPMKVAEFKQNLVESNIKNFGVANYFQTDKGLQEADAARKDPVANAARIANRKSTMIDRYGVEYPYQNAEIHEKAMVSALKYKEYTFPSGKVVKIQGYEHLALDELLTEYTEDEIFVEKHAVPRIPYEMNGTSHYYFPDIYIPKDNRLIEVKSSYTYNMQLDKNKLKEAACLAQGYLFEFRIYN